MLAIDANKAMMIIFGIENRRPGAVATDVFVEILYRSSGGPTNVVDEYSVDTNTSILNGFVFVSENKKKNILKIKEVSHVYFVS